MYSVVVLRTCVSSVSVVVPCLHLWVAGGVLDISTCSETARACATRHRTVTVWDALCSLRAMVRMPALPFELPSDSDDEVGTRGARRHVMCLDTDDE